MDSQQVKKIADLARIELTDAEVEKLKRQFADILEHVREIDRVNLEAVEPASHPFNLKNVFREDTVVPPAGQNILSIAPAFDRGMIKVPQIIEGKS
jgi:aspartyl-tRNA(Asn)/glutamyl-tRNA(Gln) amidotransferase subunit C